MAYKNDHFKKNTPTHSAHSASKTIARTVPNGIAINLQLPLQCPRSYLPAPASCPNIASTQPTRGKSCPTACTNFLPHTTPGTGRSFSAEVLKMCIKPLTIILQTSTQKRQAAAGCLTTSSAAHKTRHTLTARFYFSFSVR